MASYMRKGYPLTVIGRVKQVVGFMRTPMGPDAPLPSGTRAEYTCQVSHDLSSSGDPVH